MIDSKELTDILNGVINKLDPHDKNDLHFVKGQISAYRHVIEILESMKKEQKIQELLKP